MKVHLLRALWLGLLALPPCSAACQKSAAVAQTVPRSLGTTGDTADVAVTNVQPG